MQTNIFNLLINLLGEVRGSYGLPALSLHKHIRVQKQGAVSFATPWNRATIPRRGALPSATASAHSTLSNRGF